MRRGWGPRYLFQASTIDALLQAVYDGAVTFGELRRHGDFGIGYFDWLDGEFYRIPVDGRLYPVADMTTTPFASVTFFDPDITVEIDEPMNLTDLEIFLDGQFPSKNLFYAVRIDGAFASVRAWSVPAQEKPYPKLVEAVAGRAVFEFEFENVTGSAVGFWTPELARGVNVPGYHLHFITDDRTGGGHVLDLRLDRGSVRIDVTPAFYMVPPTEGDFCAADLSGDLRDELEAVEE